MVASGRVEGAGERMGGARAGFVHLHNHTTYSLLDGAQRLGEMCRRAAEDGQSALAITDHGNLFGVLEFRQHAERHGIAPIVGIEAYVAPGSRFERSTPPGRKPYHHLVLLAENYTGYKNLIRLASAGYLEGFYYRPRIDRELLARHHEGLVCLSACLSGEIPSLVLAGELGRAREVAGGLRDLFGPERFWLELQDHGLEEQARVNEVLVPLARELGVGLVATNDCHYLLAEDHRAHDVLVCIQTGKTVHSEDRLRYTGQHYLKTAREMAERFSWIPEAVENTLAIAGRCQFPLETQAARLPRFPVPAGETVDSYFERVVREGYAQRRVRWEAEAAAGRLRHDLEAYRRRLEEELRVIQQMGYAGYFLIVWDFMRFAREQGIPVGPGRGSAAGSLVAYCLRITDIDPMQYDLLFERFLNPERVTMPDIDIDFCFRNRERVIAYVTEKYGRANVAQIITFGTMAARAVIRDVGRALDIPYGEVDRIAKLVPQQPGTEITIGRALQEVPALAQAYRENARVRELLDIAQRLEGLVRHASTHAAGVVIAPEPIVEFAPLYRGVHDEITTQFAKDGIEAIGLLKMDFLGLKTLTLIEDALRSIELAEGRRPDLEQLPLDDPQVYALFARGRTSGIFQFESSGMQDILRRFKPERFEDLVALNALYRPGPIGGGLIDDFIQRRHGRVRVEYPHPWLEDILRETYGVIVYQEQVMQIASRMAGYTLGEADILRRAMGKKKKDVMAAERKRFVARAQQRGVDPRDAAKVFEQMEYFAGYGFNKSHSAAYALVAYRTAWLKAHYPVHFMAALLTTEKNNTDKLVRYIAECRDMGLEVLPPDVNSSGPDFTVEQGRIRFGLSAIKNVGEAAIRSILEARQRRGPFTSLHELCAETDPRLVNKRVLEALVQSGALDSLGGHRAQWMALVDQALDLGQRRRADRAAGQGGLFDRGGGDGDRASQAQRLPEVAEWDERTRLAYEKATLGFYVTGHPLQRHREAIERFATHTTATLRAAPAGAEVAVAGIVTELRRRRAKRSGAWWASFVLEDLEGRVEVLVFPQTLEAHHRDLEDARPVLVTARVEFDEDRVRLVATDIATLSALRERRAEAVRIRLEAGEIEEGLLRQLRETLEAHRGEVALYFEVARPGAFRLLARAEPARSVRPSAELAASLEALLGPGRVRYHAPAP